MSTTPQPPKWAERLIDRFAPGSLADEIKGDLFELYLIDFKRYGARRANRNYIRNSIGFLAKQFFWKRSNPRNPMMTGNYFKMARRNLLANKGTTAINVMGLVIGIASALVILSVLRFEQSFDTFHSDGDNIYRVVRISGDDLSEFRSGVSYPVGVAFREKIPAIAKLANVEYFGKATVDIIAPDGTSRKQFVEMEGIGAVEPDFFTIFDYKDKPLRWISGNQETALREINSVVLTEQLATKYFGDQSPLGQTIRLMNKFDVKVSGVISDFPSNTDFPFTLIMSYSTMPSLLSESRMKDWVSVNDSHSVFLTLQPGANVKEVEAQMEKVHGANVGADLAKFRHYLLQEFKEVHYDARFTNFSGRTISHETILALELIVLFLLLAGCINYINLSTAQSTLRSKEIGLRKVMGGSRGHLMLQFLTETFLVVLFAAFIGILAVLVLLPWIQQLLELRVEIDFRDPLVPGIILTIVVLVTLLSGVYPAMIISRFNPVAALRNKFNNEKIGGINLRKVLVVAQFTITQVLTVGTFIVIAQMEYFRNVDMGFDRNGVILNIPLYDSSPPRVRALKADLSTLPFVSDVSAAFTLPSGVDRNRSSMNIGLPGAQTVQDFQNYEYNSIDEPFLDFYGIKILAGRTLTSADTTHQILINEALSTALGFQTPQDAVGQELKKGNGERARIVGVVNNYYSNSLKEGVDNMGIDFHPERYRKLSVKLDVPADQSMTTVLTEVERAWVRHFPEWAFEYRFFDDNIELFYSQETKYSRLFQIFSVIFILIGCLGLYGLITFIANKKGKEIAIRKTLGATITNIIVMFTREYVLLIALSFFIAVPVAWYGTSEWLSSFRNHIPLHWWLFVTPGAIVLLVALMVVASKSLTAARANPVDKLKSE